MAPAGDMKWDERAMQESFYMSNMCPQAPNLNKGDWRVLEERCRKWAERYGTLFIACGPIVNESVNHKKIGRSNKVLVPDGFFKVVLKLGEHPSAIGFIFPNDDCNAPLESYAVPVDSVEVLTDIDFFHLLPDNQENLLEATNGFKRF
jgi:endonuclease G